MFTLRAASYPASIPVSLATLNLVQSTTQTFTMSIFELLRQTQSISETFGSVKKLYEIRSIPNRIVNGKIPFPEDESKIRAGVLLEFRCVASKRATG